MSVAPLLPDTEDPDAAPFWDATARGELRVQACAGCGRLRHPPRPVCPWCRSFDAEWREVSGRGTVWSYVIVHPPVLPAYAERAPYNVAVIALDEDPSIRMVGNIEPVSGEGAPIGTAVCVMFPEPVDGVVLPTWVKVTR